MANAPLMPKATAVWLVENTSLSFEQIAHLCNLHVLEVKAIADGDAAQGIKGLDPILTGQLTREEISAAEADPNYQLHIADPKVRLPEAKPKKGRATRRYRAARTGRTPFSGWCVTTPSSRTARSCGSWAPPSPPSTQSASVPTGTRPACRRSIRWTLGLCSQIDLDLEVMKAAKEKPAPIESQGATLLPASVTTAPKEEPEPNRRPSRRPRTSMSRPCSPSSSSSAARASKPAFIS